MKSVRFLAGNITLFVFKLHRAIAMLFLPHLIVHFCKSSGPDVSDPLGHVALISMRTLLYEFGLIHIMMYMHEANLAGKTKVQT